MLKPVILAEATSGAKALRQEGTLHIWRSIRKARIIVRKEGVEQMKSMGSVGARPGHRMEVAAVLWLPM